MYIIIIIIIDLFFTQKKNNSEKLPEKPQGSVNWPPVTVLNIMNNSAKK